MSEPLDLSLLRTAVAEGGPVTVGHDYAADLVTRIEALEGLLWEARGLVGTTSADMNAHRIDLGHRIDAALPKGGEGK